MSIQFLGKFFVVFGIIIALVGLALIFRESFPFLKNFGKLPGDIFIKKENFSFYFPLTTGIILSIVLSLLFYIIGKFK